MLSLEFQSYNRVGNAAFTLTVACWLCLPHKCHLNLINGLIIDRWQAATHCKASQINPGGIN